MINIAGLTPVEDPSYRYKMPRIFGKVEGRGNGIKTVLINVVELGTALNREAPEITKFFGCELGSQTTYTVDTDRAVVNGAHRDADLQNHLSKYIENFVLCKNCRLPETHYKVKAEIVSQKCLACGSTDMVDMTHKLTAFILAQHKKSKDAAKALEKKNGVAEKLKKKENNADGISSTKATTKSTTNEKVEKEKKKDSKSSTSPVVASSTTTSSSKKKSSSNKNNEEEKVIAEKASNTKELKQALPITSSIPDTVFNTASLSNAININNTNTINNNDDKNNNDIEDDSDKKAVGFNL
jgi:translation initiation factor 5